MSPTDPPAPRVAVVGNLCWDVIVRGLPELPRWGEETEGDGNLQAPGGQGYNLAVALAALGVEVALIGVVGDDAAGAQIRDAAASRGVRTGAIAVDSESPTALTAALVRTDGERAFASDFGCQRTWGLEAVLRSGTALAEAEVVCVAGSLNMPGLPLTDVHRLLRHVRAAGAITMLDTGWDPLNWPQARRRALRELLPAVDIFIPNLDEARAVTGCDDVAEAAAMLAADGAADVVVKCGSAGSVAVARDRWARCSVLDVEVRDAVGAGDTFDAGFIATRLAGGDLDACLRTASAAAGLRISGDADHWPGRAEVEIAARTIAPAPDAAGGPGALAGDSPAV